jgi:cytochrome c peroxidase
LIKIYQKIELNHCATCHNPEAGFADDRDNGVSKMASLGDDLNL